MKCCLFRVGAGQPEGFMGGGWMVITHWIDAQMDGDSGERVEGRGDGGARGGTRRGGGGAAVGGLL